ncbi:hypothetical protein JCM10207_008156 [Rhodosporidiobolus poonsookiae]
MSEDSPHSSHPDQPSTTRPHTGSSASNGQVNRRDSSTTYYDPSAADDRRPSGGARKLSRRQDDDDEGDGAPKKKGRLVLSCGECKVRSLVKSNAASSLTSPRSVLFPHSPSFGPVSLKQRRKVKCDRKIPCTACIRRGQPNDCRWDDGSINPEAQPFALAAQYDEVCSRLYEIEQFLQTLPPDVRASIPRAQRPHDETGMATPPDGLGVERSVQSEQLGVTSEMEKAAQQVEASTFPTLRTAVSSLESQQASMPPSQMLEPTAQLTSILAPPLPFAGPASAVALGLDFCRTAEEFYQLRAAALNRIYSLLPTRDVCQLLISQYLDQSAWFFHVLHLPAFHAEIDRFWEMVDSGRSDEVDPCWLGILFIVLALGLDAGESLPPSLAFQYAEKGEACLDFTAASLRLFQLSGWAKRPQFRAIQLILLHGQFSTTSTTSNDMSSFVSYIAVAIRTAQKLRLHLLGDDPSTMPADDPALPPGQNSVKRQTALRVFGLLNLLDAGIATFQFGAYLIHLEQVTSTPLANVNTSELSPLSGNWRINPAPRSTWTDSSLEYVKWRGANYMKLVVDKLITAGDNFSYDIVLELDKEIRAIANEFPAGLSAENLRMESVNPQLRKQRLFACSGGNGRMIRLHRPFVLLGYTDSRYRYSTDAALQAARNAVTAHHNGRESLVNIRIIYSNTLSGAIVIASNLFHLVDLGAVSAEVQAERDYLEMALECFDASRVASPKLLSTILRHGAAVISSLLAIAEQRRQARASGQAAGFALPSFAQVLRDIAYEMQLTPPLSAASSLAPRPAPMQNPDVLSGPYGAPPPVPQYPTFPTQLPISPSPPAGPPSAGPSTRQPFAAGFLTDMGLGTMGGGAPGAFDPSWYVAAAAPAPDPLQSLDYSPAAGAQDAAYLAQSASYAYPQSQQTVYLQQPSWAHDGQDAARAFLHQIAGP